MNDIVDTLNEMYTGRPARAIHTVAGHQPTAAQQKSLGVIADAVAEFGSPPDDITGAGALQELRARLS